MHSGDGNFIDIFGGAALDFVGTSYLVSSGIVQGTSYSFRIKSANKWGWADNFSPILSNVLAASTPNKVS